MSCRLLGLTIASATSFSVGSRGPYKPSISRSYGAYASSSIPFRWLHRPFPRIP
ncbi:unnamed protein product [Cylicocyclus nassatus]|uniref:Uncharacterized protein n=1 Tax=Cylicocyclus nassatus TaxID=53992 RepID=A0AA36HBB5_CYLNA|nr:unnamed protein product [Cylicocyclus nassatus]